MKKKNREKNSLMKALLALLLFICFSQQLQAGELTKTTKTLMLGETAVTVNVYENKAARLTFFAPHYNERPSAEAAKKIIAEKGGRLIEIQSLDENGKPLRTLKFELQKQFYNVDPNRIFTATGRKCSKFSPEIEVLIANLAAELLKVIMPAEHDKDFPVIAVHNNQDVDEKDLDARNRDLTAKAFAKSGAHEAQAQGVYLSNAETDEDNFVFLSTPAFLTFFAERNFNVVVQKPADQLFSSNCAVDDGSLSVYFGQKNAAYINLEADIRNGGFRQKQMIETVYSLIEKIAAKSSGEKKQ